MKIISFLIFLIFFQFSLLADTIIKKNNYIAFYNKKGELYKLKIDTNGDGKYDTIKFIKHKKIYKIEQDKNEDGYFETTILLKSGKVFKILVDSNKDKKPDKIFFYSDKGILEKEEIDKNFDGKMDYYLIMTKNGKIEKIDKNFDGKIDIENYYNRSGKLVKTVKNKTEIFYDKNGFPQKIIKNGNIFFYKNGIIIKAKLKDREIIYKHGKKFEEKIDSNNNRKFDTFIFYLKGIINKIEKDRNGDGKIDFVEVRDKNRRIIKIDKDYDGIFDVISFFYKKRPTKIEYFKKGCSKPIKIETGRKILYDNNCNGIFEKKQIKDNNTIKILIDKNEDKKPEKILIYSLKDKLLEIKEDTNNNGKMDTFIFFRNGKVSKIEKDTNNDGKIDLWKFYKNGKLLYTEKDLNYDGKPDIKF